MVGSVHPFVVTKEMLLLLLTDPSKSSDLFCIQWRSYSIAPSRNEVGIGIVLISSWRILCAPYPYGPRHFCSSFGLGQCRLPWLFFNKHVDNRRTLISKKLLQEARVEDSCVCIWLMRSFVDVWAAKLHTGRSMMYSSLTETVWKFRQSTGMYENLLVWKCQDEADSDCTSC